MPDQNSASTIARTKARFSEIDALSRSAEESPAEELSGASPAEEAAMDAYPDAIDSAFAKRGGGAAAWPLPVGLVRTGHTGVLREVLPDALPWSTFLPAADVDLLIGELVDTARGAVSPGNLAPIALLLTRWRHTAEVYADPALLALVTREPDGDHGPVPVPGAAE